MSKLVSYFKEKYIFYLFSFLIIGIFYLILYLYGALIAAIDYAFVLSLTVIIIYFGFDFYHYLKKIKQLDYLIGLENIYVSDLPISHHDIEEKYQVLLKKMNQLHKELKANQEKQYNDMIDYFTLWVHQIKTPISALRLLIQSKDIAQNDLLIQVLKIEQYVEMVMHYMKIDHMSSDMKIKRYKLENILNDVIKKQATFFIHKNIQLKLEPISLQILTDEKWISFVLEQILSNALKYTKQGFIHIYVKDETLFIEDTGIGIKEDDLPRIFEKGFTGYNGRVDKKASGLGLYLCKQVIDNLGYHISIESVASKGTIVSIDFHVDDLKVE